MEYKNESIINHLEPLSGTLKFKRLSLNAELLFEPLNLNVGSLSGSGTFEPLGIFIWNLRTFTKNLAFI